MTDLTPITTLWAPGSRVAFAAAALAGVVSGGSTAALIALVNGAVARGGRWGAAALAAFAALCVVRLASGVAAHLLLVSLSQRVIYRLRVQLCEDSVATPLADLERIGPARLFATFNDDVLHFANASVQLPYQFVNVVVLLGCAAYLGWLSPAVLAGVALLMGVGTASYALPVVWANRALRRARREQDRLVRHFRSVVDGVKELKASGLRRRQFLDSMLRPAAEAVRRHNTRGVGLYTAAANWNRLLFFVYVALLLQVYSSWSSSLEARLDAALLPAVVITVLYMMAPAEAIMNALPVLAQAAVALRHVRSLGLTRADAGAHDGATSVRQGEPATATATQPRELRRTEPIQTVELAGVTYHYAHDDGRGFGLGPIDLVLRRGEVVFVVGGNGSGKTTLVKVLTGMYEPRAGELHVDGRAVGPGDREWYRQQVSAVFADFHLHDALLGFQHADLDRRAGVLLRRLGLADAVQVRDAVWSTTSLSQGQRKRLALVSALLEDRPVYVFDEWAADQDPHWRRTFYDEVIPDLRRRGKAVLVITHDDRFYGVADRLVTLEEGRTRADASGVGAEYPRQEVGRDGRRNGPDGNLSRSGAIPDEPM